jgi:hypothetical protein
MHLRVTVDLARRGQQEAGALELRQPERVVGSLRADLQGLQRQPQIVDRAGRARQVIDEVDRLLDPDRHRQIVRHKHQLLRPHVLDIRQRTRLQVVHTHHPIATPQQRVAEMRTQKTGTARDDRSGQETSRSMVVRRQ